MFQFVSADTPELLKEVFRIRYQVYCVENEFEDPERNPGGLERDEFDDHSVHALLVHCASNAPVGTVRLVLHKTGARHGTLPFHRICRQSEAHRFDFLPYETTAEFSRFAISKRYRNAAAQKAGNRVWMPAEVERSAIPHITIGLIGAALRLCFANGITHVCAVMEPTLLRLLSRFGIRFQPLGPQVNYHGLRQPCFTQLAALMEGIEFERGDVWDAVTDGGQLWPRTAGATSKVSGTMVA
jgi:N-acyl amino acid synthase of PEP-CTERM/exosortase system